MLADRILKFFSPASAFVVDEVDHDRSVIILADKSIDLKVEVKLDEERKLKSAKIVAPYDVLLDYEDGISKIVRFLK